MHFWPKLIKSAVCKCKTFPWKFFLQNIQELNPRFPTVEESSFVRWASKCEIWLQLCLKIVQKFDYQNVIIRFKVKKKQCNTNVYRNQSLLSFDYKFVWSSPRTYHSQRLQFYFLKKQLFFILCYSIAGNKFNQGWTSLSKRCTLTKKTNESFFNHYFPFIHWLSQVSPTLQSKFGSGAQKFSLPVCLRCIDLKAKTWMLAKKEVRSTRVQPFFAHHSKRIGWNWFGQTRCKECDIRWENANNLRSSIFWVNLFWLLVMIGLNKWSMISNH